ncbi:MAG: T9SS type A sorting domain-containing protein [Lentimicrobiaceae bacterium]
MKKQLLICIFWGIMLSGQSQFVPQPLNYPGQGYWPAYISISDPEHVWVGTTHEFNIPYSYSIKTSNGGVSWTHDSIPVPGEPYCTSICEWDKNTCFFVFTDVTEAGGSIWKTTNGGSTWSCMTTNQFDGSFANFYHAFSANAGVAMGDPKDGYFVIQVTNDGGETWTRVPSISIPTPLEGEYGMNDSYSAVGNSIWFTTNKGRCFRSFDRGQHWDVTRVVDVSGGFFDVCFSSEHKGAFFSMNDSTRNIAVTIDGGINWDTVSIPQSYYILDMSSVGGFDGGFVFTGWKDLTDVFFTPDMFTGIVKIGSSIISSGSVAFLDASTGWLAGGESGTNEIFKYMGVLSSANQGSAIKHTEKLLIMPNPTSDKALLKLQSDDVGTKFLTLLITDMCGKVVKQQSILSSEWAKLDASDYDNGIYMVYVFSGNEMPRCVKWVINH